MRFSTRSLCLTSVFLIRSIVTASPFLTSDSSEPNYWFSFGDSYTATGFFPWGPLPSPGNPLGNPPVPGTITGGPYWVDYLTTTYNQSLTLTYNFAFSGATTNASLVLPWLGVTFEDEVNIYLHKFSQKPPSTPWESNNTLFSIWIGINDIGRTYNDPGDRDAQTGARLFYFINIPPIDRTPLMLQRSASEQDQMKAVVQGFNPKLQTRITNFGQNHTDVNMWTWDSHAAFTAILDSPGNYGFQDITHWNPIDPTYFWGNNFHPGSTAHNIFAQEMRANLTDFPW
ncbi:carbohydrate esterase family 16 protein [Amanita muscaria Koide BX008]|uniref:Carbohydrate esterase family 16 protein n=1 Tax=Amanita muscaria (strain Koide BX008) TaxID=946122 RepID=A0A0C2WSU9_AMAMK|nr:carbohydrate esterase family 16 protein [Amanita muscaria Koide BX008]